MSDLDFFDKTLELLAGRHAYHPVLWSYGIHHNRLERIQEYLRSNDGFLRRFGDYVDCTLAVVDPVERHWRQHLEYSPLVNARAHRLGRDRKIVNSAFRNQYVGLDERAAVQGRTDRRGLARRGLLPVPAGSRGRGAGPVRRGRREESAQPVADRLHALLRRLLSRTTRGGREDRRSLRRPSGRQVARTLRRGDGSGRRDRRGRGRPERSRRRRSRVAAGPVGVDRAGFAVEGRESRGPAHVPEPRRGDR